MGLVGKPLDGLSLKERATLSGMWIALEIYTPETLPLRTIEALGKSTLECVGQLRERGLDVTRFEFTLMGPPY